MVKRLIASLALIGAMFGAGSLAPSAPQASALDSCRKIQTATYVQYGTTYVSAMGYCGFAYGECWYFWIYTQSGARRQSQVRCGPGYTSWISNLVAYPGIWGFTVTSG
jgi:hypothetical protein